MMNGSTISCSGTSTVDLERTRSWLITRYAADSNGQLKGPTMLEKLRRGLQPPGASPAEIEDCEARLKVTLPEDYKAFLRLSNGFNDELGQGYLVLWSLDELSRADGYEMFEFKQDRFLIGSNGGPTAYGVIGGNYISIPFVFAGPWQDEVKVLGRSFEDFISAIESGQGS
jgi:hypothetical protein